MERLAARLDRVLAQLAEEPNDAQLRLHALRGDLEGSQTIWVTYELRIVLQIRQEDQTIVLLDIGTHDEVYG